MPDFEYDWKRKTSDEPGTRVKHRMYDWEGTYHGLELEQ